MRRAAGNFSGLLFVEALGEFHAFLGVEASRMQRTQRARELAHLEEELSRKDAESSLRDFAVANLQPERMASEGAPLFDFRKNLPDQSIAWCSHRESLLVHVAKLEQKLARADIADLALLHVARRVYQHRRRHALDFVLAGQLFGALILRGQIRFHPHESFRLGDDRWIDERRMLHLAAWDTPLRAEIDQHRLALFGCGCGRPGGERPETGRLRSFARV